MTIERMFVAVTLPPEVIDAISDLPTKALRGVRFTKRSQWHITVRYLGDCERHEALAALDSLRAPSTDVTLGPEVALLGTRVVMLPANGLDQVAASVATAFEGIGEPAEYNFSGHLTLARLKGAPLRDPSKVSVLGAPLSASFHVDTIDLIKTELTPEGSTYTVVATQDLVD